MPRRGPRRAPGSCLPGPAPAQRTRELARPVVIAHRLADVEDPGLRPPRRVHGPDWFRRSWGRSGLAAWGRGGPHDWCRVLGGCHAWPRLAAQGHHAEAVVAELERRRVGHVSRGRPQVVRAIVQVERPPAHAALPAGSRLVPLPHAAVLVERAVGARGPCVRADVGDRADPAVGGRGGCRPPGGPPGRGGEPVEGLPLRT